MSKNATFYSAFVLVIAVAATTSFYFYHHVMNVWRVYSLSIVIILGLASFIGTLVLFTLTDTKRKVEVYIRTGIIVLNIFLFLFIIILSFGGNTTSHTQIKTVASENEEYVIDFYEFPIGFYGENKGRYGELDGPLGFKKRIYLELYSINELQIEWKDSSTLVVNGKVINLADNE